MLNNAVRVKNEVSAITLMRDALSSHDSGLVLEAEGHGWIIEERMHGQALYKSFPTMLLENQKDILRQIAQLFKAIQSYDLPHTITGYGGLAFGAKGGVISGATTIWFGGPFDASKEMHPQIFEKQLELAETTQLVNGWKETRLSGSVSGYSNLEVLKRFSKITVTRLTLVHGDVSE
jgi:hypothetical protein